MRKKGFNEGEGFVLEVDRGSDVCSVLTGGMVPLSRLHFSDRYKLSD